MTEEPGSHRSTWRPLDLGELRELIQHDLADCSDRQRPLFATVAIEPEKWRQSPFGNEGRGFWAVADHEGRVLWFNDIEDGFNVSNFAVRGEIPIDEYVCSQDRLCWALSGLFEES